MPFIPKILVVSNLQVTSPLWMFRNLKQPWDITLETRPAGMIERWTELLPDLIVCDIDPDSLALTLIAELREEAVLPILLLTSNHSDTFILEAYGAGVDECISKPIHPWSLRQKSRPGCATPPISRRRY